MKKCFIPEILLKSLLTLCFFSLIAAKSVAYDRTLSPGDYRQFGSIQQNANGSITFTLIVNNDQGCNDVWDWLRIEAILPNNSRIVVLEGNNDYLSGYNFMVDDPNDNINVYFKSNYSFSLNNVYDTDGGDLHIRVTWNNPPKLKDNNNLVLKGRWSACGNDWVGEWNGDEWMRSAYQVYNGFSPQAGTKLGILQYWAPRVYHDTRDDNVCVGAELFGNCIGSRYRFYKEQDMISKVDFDGDWNAKNNWENNCHGNNGNPIAPRAHAYSSFVETETHYFLGYHFFHPTDDAEISDDRHENDMEDVYLCIKKSQDTFGTCEAMLTNAHGSYKAYRRSDLQFTNGHPHILITSNGIGLADYAGLLGSDDHGHSIYKYVDNAIGSFGGGNGIIYNIANDGDIPNDCNSKNDGTYPQYKYSLIDVNELWSRRFDVSHNPFMSYGDFGGEGSDGKGPGAHMAWQSAELNNPSVKFLEYFPELDDNAAWSYNYLHNPFINGSNGSDASIQFRGVLPSGWQSANIGSPAKTGLTYFTNGTFTMEGAGNDIWGPADQFNYVYTPLIGNGEIVARVYSVQNNVNVWSKAGVMIRESADANARFAMMSTTSHNGVSFQYRNATGGECNHLTNGSFGNPVWIKVSRQGNIFNAYYSTEGQNWIWQGQQSIDMATNALVGLALTSHDANWLVSATFDNVSVNGGSVFKSASIGNTVDAFTLVNRNTDGKLVARVTPNDIQEKDVLVYPNPLNGDALTLKLTGLPDSYDTHLTIHSSEGKLVYQNKFIVMDKIQLNRALFKPGLYLITIRSGEFLRTKKLIVK